MADPFLSPEDLNYFSTARRRVNDTFNLGGAQNKYQRDVAANAFGRQQNNLLTQFAQMRDKLPYTYASRGLLNSGIYQKGLADFAQRKNQAIGDLAGGYADQLGGFDLAQRQLGQVRSGALMDLDEQQQARIAATAAALRAAR